MGMSMRIKGMEHGEGIWLLVVEEIDEEKWV